MEAYLPVFLLCFLSSALAKPDGAPTSACQSLRPVHRNIPAQNSEAPYRVKAVPSGNKIQVTIDSDFGEQFEGFILQARSSADRSRIINGKFTESEVSKTMDCFRGKKNSLTQVSANPKKKVVTTFTPSDGINEEIVFRATVAQTFAMFWTEIDSSPIWVRSDGSSSSNAVGRSGGLHRMYADCYTSKGCFGYPSGCVTSGDCEVLLTYAKISNGIRFTMHGYLEDKVYMAMAFSTDARMGDDSVTECFRQGSDIIARQSWNEGKSNTRTEDLPRNSYDAVFTNGLATCSWVTPFVTESNGRRYNLAENTYYALLAKGPVTDGRLGYHTGRIASQQGINFTALEEVESEGVSDAVKVHGTFMVTAWVGFVSLGILLARHFKGTWEDSTLCGVKIWFAFHRGFMIAALVFTVVAFIVIFVYKGGWNYQTRNPHAVLGCIATALGLFQPIMASFRPSPDHPKRPVFNFLHWFVGNLAQIIAVIAIFFAKSLEASGLADSFYVVMGIFVVVHLIFHFLFQLHGWTSAKKKINELSMNEMNGNGRANNMQNAQAKNVSENVFRILMLGIYSIFLIVIILALYALIGVA